MKSISKIDSEKLNALKPIFIFFKKATGWFIGSIFIFGGLISFESNGVASSIAIIILGLLLVPSFWNFIVIKKLKLKIGWIIRLIIYFFLILVFALSAKPTAIQNNQEAMVKESSENLYAPIDVEDEKKEQEMDTNPLIDEAVASPTLTPTPTSEPTPEPTEDPIKYTAEGFPDDAIEVKVSNLDKAPSKYFGEKIKFTCIASSFMKDGYGGTSYLNCYEVGNISAMILIETYAVDPTEVNDGDKIRVYGNVIDIVTGTNAFGGSVTKTSVMPVYFYNVTTGWKNY